MIQTPHFPNTLKDKKMLHFIIKILSRLFKKILKIAFLNSRNTFIVVRATYKNPSLQISLFFLDLPAINRGFFAINLTLNFLLNKIKFSKNYQKYQLGITFFSVRSSKRNS